MATAAMWHFGGIDILVNNALMQEIPLVPLLELPLEWFERIMRVNMMGALVCTRAVVSHLKQRGGGRVINQSSAGPVPPGRRLFCTQARSGEPDRKPCYGARANRESTLTLSLPRYVETAASPSHVGPDDPRRVDTQARIPGKKQTPPWISRVQLLLLASSAGDGSMGRRSISMEVGSYGCEGDDVGGPEVEGILTHVVAQDADDLGASRFPVRVRGRVSSLDEAAEGGAVNDVGGGMGRSCSTGCRGRRREGRPRRRKER
jgi:hypothetical protein